MAKVVKVQTFSLSTAEDEVFLAEFLEAHKGDIEHIVAYDSKILVVYKE